MRQSATQTRLYCPRCGTIHTIFRKTAKQKKFGHYKNFYCYKCKHTHNHIELRDDCGYTEDKIQELIEQMKAEGKF
jgi:ssDNA-binding Zn-finger/Zn-ribbon topoisomerase 1